MRKEEKRFTGLADPYLLKRNLIHFYPDGDGTGDPGAGGSTEGKPPIPVETFDFTDPVTKEVHKIPESQRKLHGHMISNARSQAEDKYKPLLTEIKTKHSEMLTKHDALRDKVTGLEEANMTADERASAAVDREKKESKEREGKLKKERDESQGLFQSHKKDTDIMKALGKYELYDANQARILLSSKGKPTIVKDEATGVYKTVLKLSLPDESGKMVEQELSPEEAAEKFLALPESSNLLRTNLRPGGGTKQTGGKLGTDGAIVYSDTDLEDSKKFDEFSKQVRNKEEVRIE